MPTQVTLADAVEAILEGLRQRLDDATAPAGRLAGIAAVVRGDRARPMPANPSLWIVPEPATADHTTHGLAEAWTLPITLAALVSNDDPEEGGKDCVRYAALARQEALRGRDLGLAYVADIVSTRFDAAARSSERNRNLHWADATVTVRFKVWEASS
jgi:hypothetical protein